MDIIEHLPRGEYISLILYFLPKPGVGVKSNGTAKKMSKKIKKQLHFVFFSVIINLW